MDVKSICQGRQLVGDLNYSSTNINGDVQRDNVSNSLPEVKNVDAVNLSQNGNGSKYKQNSKQIGEKEVKDAADKLNKLFEGKDTHVEYEFVGKSKQISIKIINNDTKEILKEIPPKKIVEMIDKLCELAGIMVDEKA